MFPGGRVVELSPAGVFQALKMGRGAQNEDHSQAHPHWAQGMGRAVRRNHREAWSTSKAMVPEHSGEASS